MSTTAERKVDDRKKEDLKKEIVREYQRTPRDSGSPQVQVALLTERIRGLTEHMKEFPKDYASERGLMRMVSRRTNLLLYLARTDRAGYQKLITALGLRK
jgi:small subunit ribosomal protein S15